MDETKRYSEVKKVGEVIADIRADEFNSTDKLAVVRSELAVRADQEIEFAQKWAKLDIPQKAMVVYKQVKGVVKTAETASLIGRVSIVDDPKLFMYLLENFYKDYDLETADAVRHADLFIEEYPNIAIQDMALFFKKFTFGLYGKLYGKMTFPKMMEFFNNFMESVNYNVRIFKDREHLTIKEIEGHRDIGEWLNNGKPENLE
jgi:hypothetical protein